MLCPSTPGAYILSETWSSSSDDRKLNFSLYGVQSQLIIDHRSYTHNLSSCEIKA